MVLQQEKIEFVRIGLDDAAARLAHMAGWPKVDTSDGMCTIEELIGTGAAFVAKQDGETVLIFGLKKIAWKRGTELLITIAHQVGGRGDLTEKILPLIEYRFGHDCQAMRVHTRRRGLVAKLEKQGYTQAAYVMRKKL